MVNTMFIQLTQNEHAQVKILGGSMSDLDDLASKISGHGKHSFKQKYARVYVRLCTFLKDLSVANRYIPVMRLKSLMQTIETLASEISSTDPLNITMYNRLWRIRTELDKIKDRMEVYPEA